LCEVTVRLVVVQLRGQRLAMPRRPAATASATTHR
ncbi:MAG: hypothetical protein QOF35_1385, partial [Actinomycetota bacterium]|nr:hypothetical protein [Actinomycetota bacterium]